MSGGRIEELEGAVAIVTGGGSGIGRASALSLARLGMAVVVAGRRPQLLADTAGAILSEGGRAVAFPCDLGDSAAPAALVAAAVAEFGRVDAIVNNAATITVKPFAEWRAEELDEHFAVNVRAPFLIVQAALPQLRASPVAAVVNISSSSGSMVRPGQSIYGMSKAALEMLAKNLVIDLSPYKINVNAVAPGATATERTTSDPNYEKVWSTITPMGRPASTLDIAHAAVFLVSPQARHITGQTLVIDGGWTSVSPSPY